MTDDGSVLALRLPDGTLVELPPERPLLIGTRPGNGGLTLEGPGVSARHAAVARLKSGGFGIKAIDAEATTLLDDRPVRQARLSEGARLQLGETTLEVVDPRRRPEPAPAASEQATHDGPQRVGGFRIERLIGRGSMGRVFLAVQESLDRQVALKLLRPELVGDRDFVARFQAEARAAAALSHPNVVTVYDVGEADGHRYLALEYMQRGSLEDRLRTDGPLPWRATLAVLRDAASGLEFAERTGLVHRDIKPANLMQTATGATKLVDLGLATSIEATAESAEVIRGTPHFMSPEQARGAPLDVRSDLFSLGATAYRLLTGRTPFEGDSSKAILRAVVQDAPAPIRTVVPDVPRPLEELIEALMAKDPADRPASGAAACARIEELIGRLGGLTPGVTESPSGSRRLLLLGALLLLVLVVGGGVAAFLLGDDAKDADPRATAGSEATADAGDGLVLDEGSSATPAPGAIGAAGNDGDPQEAAFDPEALLEEAERAAEVALLQAGTLTEPEERRTALLEVARVHQGTNAAREAEAQALAIDSEGGPDAEDPAAGAPSADVATSDAELLEHLRAAARDDADDWLPPQAAFDALARRAPPAGVPQDIRYEELRRSVELELELALRAVCDARLARADAELIAGRLDAADVQYRELETWLRFLPPELEEALASPVDEEGNPIEERLDASKLPTDREGVMALLAQDEALEGDYVWRLMERITLVEARSAALAERWRERYAEAMLQRDRAELARALPGGAFEQSLRAFDLRGAGEALGRIQGDLRSTPCREGIAEASDRIRAARAMFAVLAEEWRREGWRRRTVPIPGADRETGETRAATPAGLLVQTDGGTVDVPWTAFADDSESLEELFGTRLDRDWTAAERAAIGDLIGLAATNQALGRFDPVFDRGRRGRLSPGESDEIATAFRRALDFAGRPDGGPLVRDGVAARYLCEALLALDDEDWATSSFAFQRLLEEAPMAPLTLLLSEGTPQGAVVEWPPELEPAPVWEPAVESLDSRDTFTLPLPEAPPGPPSLGGGAGRPTGDGRNPR